MGNLLQIGKKSKKNANLFYNIWEVNEKVMRSDMRESKYIIGRFINFSYN